MYGIGYTARRRTQRILVVLGMALAFAVPAAASPAVSTAAADVTCVANSVAIADSADTASVPATAVCPPSAPLASETGRKVG